MKLILQSCCADPRYKHNSHVFFSVGLTTDATLPIAYEISFHFYNYDHLFVEELLGLLIVPAYRSSTLPY
jgi:hypothetical protein